MITLSKKHRIINLYLEGKSKSHIARTMHISRDTVRKYIREYEHHESSMVKANSESERESIIMDVSTKPRYDTSNRKRYKLTDALVERVKFLLKENDTLKQRGQRKLIRKKIDIHEVLMEEGYDISYRSICALISSLENKPKEAFVRQSIEAGEMAEFDWGEVTLTIDGVDQTPSRYFIAVFTLRYSNYQFARLYTLENTASFNDAHIAFFEAIRGAPKEIVYDNAKTALKRFVGRYKEPTDALKRLSTYYGYTPRFTNPYSGHEKGAVERSVEILRRKAYSGIQRFKTLRDAQAVLTQKTMMMNERVKQRSGTSASAAFAREQPQLLPKRVPLDSGVLTQAHVDKYGFIYVDSNFYSVPDYLVGRKLTVKKYPFHLEIIHHDRFLTRLERIYGRNRYKVDIMHYIQTLKKKPGAIKRSLILRSSADWLQQLFQTHYSTAPKEFVKLLELINHHPLDHVRRVITSLEQRRLRVNTELIKQGLIRDTFKPSAEPLENTRSIEHYAKAQVNAIGALYQEKGGGHET